MHPSAHLFTQLQAHDLLTFADDLGLNLWVAGTKDNYTHLETCADAIGPAVPVPASKYLAADLACLACSRRAMKLLRALPSAGALFAVLGAFDAVSAVRDASTSGPVTPYELMILIRDLDDAAAEVARDGVHHPDTSTRLSGETASALDSLRAACTGAARADLLDALRSELVPHEFLSWVTLDTAPVLIGMFPRPPMTGYARVARELLAVPGPAGARLLLAPRWVADVMQRAIGVRHDPVYLAVTAAGDDEFNRAVSQLWAPAGTGPLRHLVAAATAVRDLQMR